MKKRKDQQLWTFVFHSNSYLASTQNHQRLLLKLLNCWLQQLRSWIQLLRKCSMETQLLQWSLLPNVISVPDVKLQEKLWVLELSLLIRGLTKYFSFQDYNLAELTSQNYPVVFNIMFWFTIIFVFSLIAISLALSNVEDKDSIIYRMTGARGKKDN